MLVNKVYLQAYQTNSENIDDNYNHIIFEFGMNYTVDSIRECYIKRKKEMENKADAELLRSLGYSDKDILASK